MKLKKLEINGFKSFHETTGIEFPPGVSAVVGPNGCGKSNVIDAIRWVMGEMSAKQLRGKSMEDLLFAGANGRAPINMAEVRLTLTNDNGNSPEAFRDFSEIMLSRRLYRSGESAYAINRQPCRLKDIHALFADCGLGAKSHAVIEQGNIGALTDASPEERRFFLEQAAGVTGYKARKTEALRKVDATQQNLLRVTDIIAEVERQMRSLKRQAAKARRYAKIRSRIRFLDIRLSLDRFDRVSKRITEISALLQETRPSS